MDLSGSTVAPPDPSLARSPGAHDGPTPGSDRRKEPRCPATLDARLDTATGVIACKTRDISLAGLCVETSSPLSLGDEVTLTLGLPTLHLPLVLIAVVRWVDRGRAAGLQFMGPRAHDVWALRRFIASRP